jgi:hypothetical protein
MIAKVPTIKAHNIWLTTGDETRRKAAVEFVVKGLETGSKSDDALRLRRQIEPVQHRHQVIVLHHQTPSDNTLVFDQRAQ